MASQLLRLKQKNIPLIVSVDKVAASGGYMMACVADQIIAAPFAISRSVGVVAQVPNIHRLLKKHDVDVVVMTAGEYKQTLTLMGENTEKGRIKFQQELNETHSLFKKFVTKNRPIVDIDKVATGERWFGEQAIKLKLIDQISTSNDILLNNLHSKDLLLVKYKKSTPQLLVGESNFWGADQINRTFLLYLYSSHLPKSFFPIRAVHRRIKHTTFG